VSGTNGELEDMGKDQNETSKQLADAPIWNQVQCGKIH
jgi:hypothetical protein